MFLLEVESPPPRIILGVNFLVYQIYSVFIHDIRQGRIQEKVQLQIFTSGDYIKCYRCSMKSVVKKVETKKIILKFRILPHS